MYILSVVFFLCKKGIFINDWKIVKDMTLLPVLLNKEVLHGMLWLL